MRDAAGDLVERGEHGDGVLDHLGLSGERQRHDHGRRRKRACQDARPSNPNLHALRHAAYPTAASGMHHRTGLPSFNGLVEYWGNGVAPPLPLRE
jgi:hypothetical protein